MATDPVCKTRVDELDSHSVDVGDVTFYFCSHLCKQVFEEDPELFSSDEYNGRRFTYSRAGEVSLRG